MVNASAVGDLNPGECFIEITPFGGSALPCAKIAQYRASVYAADGSEFDVTWSTIPAEKAGQADLITEGVGPTGVVTGVTLTDGGFGYTTPPAVTFPGGSGATATTTVSNGVVDSITLGAGGSGYTSGSATIAAPDAPGTAATATGTTDGDAVDSITVTDGGGYYTSAPTVTISGGGGAGATATAVLGGGGVVASITIDNGGTGYTAAPTVTIAAPTANSNATATFTAV